MSRSKTLALFVALATSVSVPAACALGPHQCLQMSDCERGFMCVEGTCETNESLTPATDGEGGAASTATDQ